jgi:hypothetical protein
MLPWLVPGMELSDFKAMVTLIFKEWDSIGFLIEPTFLTYDNFYEAWQNHFSTESVGASKVRTTSPIIPRKNWNDAEIREKTFDKIQAIVEEGSVLISYKINSAAPGGVADSALNPAWRDASMFAIVGSGWDVISSTPTRSWLLTRRSQMTGWSAFAR